jgi:hypothetical protein
LCNLAILDEDIKRTTSKLQAKGTPDATERLFKLLQQQEIRTELLSRGVTGDDTLVADNAYRDAMSRNDHLAMEALENWPLGSPVSPDLIAQGQTARYGTIDPVAAQKLEELQSFKQALTDVERDALGELPLMSQDEISRLAGPEPDEAA